MATELKRTGAARISDRQGTLQYKSITTAGDQFTSAVPVWIHEVVFYPTAAAPTALTCTIEAEGQLLFGGASVPVPALNSALSSNAQAPAQYGPIVWRPHRPILLTQQHFIRFVPSATVGVVLRGDVVDAS